jgi:RND family efflux transporter MFP subunit
MNDKNRRLLALLPLALLAGCTAQAAKPSLAEVDRTPRVEAVKPQYLAREDSIELLATVEPMEKADLAAQVPGEIRGLKGDIDIGRRITKGEKLFTLYIPAIKAEQENKHAMLKQAQELRDQAIENKKVAAQDVKEAEALVDRYKADVEYRKLHLKRTRQMVKREALQPQLEDESRLQLKTAQAAYSAARVTVQSKKARLKAAEVALLVAESRIKVARADVKLVDTRVAFATIRAPFNGVITRRWVDNGAVIKDPGTLLLTVMRSNIVRVLVDIPERYVRHIRALHSKYPRGKPNLVRMKIDGYDLEGRVTRLASAIDNTTRLMRAEIHVRNSAHVHLRPGMTGTATVVLDESKKKRLNIPSTALVQEGDKLLVYYVDKLSGDSPPSGQVKTAVVTRGLDDGTTVEILSGLTGKEMVLVKANNGVVREGERVLVVKPETLKPK